MANNCNGCGLCCKLFLINLSKKEYESKRYETMFQGVAEEMSFSKAKECGANFLAKKDDNSCIYLKENKCSIHNDRPKVCRDFFCTTKAKKYKEMVKIIDKNDVDSRSSLKEK